MGWIRFVHFTAAAVLVTTASSAFYWLFAGNKYERWLAAVPDPTEGLGEHVQAGEVLPDDPAGEGAPLSGPQPAAAAQLHRRSMAWRWSQVVTGFALYGQSDPGGFFFRAFGWIGPLLGGMPVVRFVHHVSTWVFLIFIPIHVYLATRADLLERGGTISSIITGGRFVPAGERFSMSEPAAAAWSSVWEPAHGRRRPRPRRARATAADWVLPPGVELVDGGTWGINLLPLLEAADQVLFLDAVDVGKAPGEPVELTGGELPLLLGIKLSVHQIDLREVLALAQLRGTLPSTMACLGLQPASVEMRSGLSPVLQERMVELVTRAAARLQAWGHPLRRPGVPVHA